MQLARSAALLGLASGLGYWLARYLRPRHSVLVLNDKVVLLTGASSGIGRELALAFAKQGATLVLAARREERLEAVRREIEPYAADVLLIPTDLSDDAQIKALITTTLDKFGRLDVLVNNAGVTHNGFLHEQDGEWIRRMTEVNLTAAIRLTQEVLPSMLLQRQGYIVNVGAMASHITAPMFSSYNATKSGLEAFSKGLRRELLGTGIQVTLALPVWTRTASLHSEWDAGLRYFQLPIEDADKVAAGIVEGLVRGESEIIFGGIGTRGAIFLERHLPRLMDAYWYWLGRRWTNIAQHIHSD